MDDNKDKVENVQANDITSVDTEQKDNKKRIIIISSIVASVVIIGLISWFIVTAIDKGQEFVNGVSDSMNNIAENIPSLDLDITLESETTTELETTTEQPITEEQTTEESTTVDPLTLAVEGSYTDKVANYELCTYIRTYENGAIRYVFISPLDGTFYEIDDPNVVPQWVVDDLLEKIEEDEMEVIKQTTTAPKVPTEEERIANLKEWDKERYDCTPNEEIHKLKIQWLRDNYGDKFTCNGMEFTYDSSYADYIAIEKKNDVHLMTSKTTSIIGYDYYKRRYYRVAEYLGYYGTDHILYNNTEAFEYAHWIESGVDEGTTAPNAEAINEGYVKELGWTEDIKVSGEYHFWDFISTEEVPVSIYEDGYLTINIKYPTDTKYNKYKFTIEEYNEFVAIHKWIVSSDTSYSGFGSASSVEDAIAQGWTKNITKYLIVEE
ncbi:MAG: hypothetical protein IJD58_08350 [Lachnospiraceae bacterium]|nr:hypothetical protein [Lachnospiraceae bacterium]